jgi:hypothetical protein
LAERLFHKRLHFTLVASRRGFVTPVDGVANEVTKQPGEMAPALPREMGRVVMRCLRKDPEYRFKTWPI